jgi:hypothetical protein
MCKKSQSLKKLQRSFSSQGMLMIRVNTLAPVAPLAHRILIADRGSAEVLAQLIREQFAFCARRS